MRTCRWSLVGRRDGIEHGQAFSRVAASILAPHVWRRVQPGPLLRGAPAPLRPSVGIGDVAARIPQLWFLPGQIFGSRSRSPCLLQEGATDPEGVLARARKPQGTGRARQLQRLRTAEAVSGLALHLRRHGRRMSEGPEGSGVLHLQSAARSRRLRCPAAPEPQPRCRWRTAVTRPPRSSSSHRRGRARCRRCRSFRR